MNEDISKIADQIKSKGFISIKNFLGTENLDLAEKVLSHKNLKGKDSTYPIFIKHYLIKLLKMDIGILNKSLILKKIAKNLQLKSIAEKVFESDVELHMIDSYYSEKSEKDILTWHNDIGLGENKKDQNNSIKKFYNESEATLKNKKNKVSSRGIKFFIYMTDVQSNNGALAVIPFSNQVVKTITSLILDKKIDLKPYWSLKSLRDLVENKKNKNLISNKLGTEIVENFLSNTNFINEEKKDSSAFDLEMQKGSAVIFDELCVHRGSAPKRNSRVVLRYLYRKK
tara:strand:+ start:137 stop:988 length:852 start_codon:yes stop_codon:yes gene_type:complete